VKCSRREFLRSSALGAGALASAEWKPLLAAKEPHLRFPTAPRDRLAVTSWPFRAYIESPTNRDRDHSKPGMDLKDFAGMVAERFNIHNINPLAAHFSSTEPAYIEEFRMSVGKAGSHMVDLGLGGRSFYHPDAAKRREAIDYGKKWIDVAVLVGSPSVRQHVNGAPGVKPDVALTAETLGEMAAYGATKNIAVILENDDPVGEDPFFLVAVIEKAGNPYLRALPDFANSMAPDGDAERNYKGVEGMFKHAFNMCHVKKGWEDHQGKLHPVDLARLFAIARRAGYHGYFSMEAESAGDPYANTQETAELTLKYLTS
jgi:sugar phosphate isomerase/epimerase